MLLEICASLLACVLAAGVVARGGLIILRRLGLDPVAVMLWLGLAERPLELPRGRRLREL